MPPTVVGMDVEEEPIEPDTRYWLLHGGKRIRIGGAYMADLVEAIRAIGGTVEVEDNSAPARIELRTKKVPDPDFVKALQALERAEAKQHMVKDLSGPFLDLGCFWLWANHAEIRTPTRLGVAEHLRRRGELERLLRAWGALFEIDCVTEHSSNVCRPVTAQEPA